MSMTVLVTGANGHLGLNTVRSLLGRGYQVRAFVRKSSDLTGLQGLPVQLSYGDVRDRASLNEAIKSCQAVIHHAAIYKTWARTTEEIIEPAMAGTRNIFEAAKGAGIERIVYTSSTYAVGVSDDPDVLMTDKDWNNSELVPYGIAKTESEKLAWQLSGEFDIPLITICPGAVFGRFDYRVTPSNRILLDMMKGIGLTVKGVISFVDARDVGEIHAMAVEQGIIGQRYIMALPVAMKEVGKMVSHLTGRFVPYLPFGRSVNIATARMMEVGAGLTGWTPLFTVGVASEFSHRFAQYDSSRAIRDFGFTFRQLEEAVEDTIRWFLFLDKARLSKKRQAKYPADPSWPKK